MNPDAQEWAPPPPSSEKRIPALKATTPKFQPALSYNEKPQPLLDKSSTATTLKATASMFLPTQSNNQKPEPLFEKSSTTTLKAAAPIFLPVLSPDQRAQPLLEKSSYSGPPYQRSLCKFFAEGACRKGLSCPFLHDSSTLIPLDVTSEGNKGSTISNKTTPYFLEDGIEAEFGAGAVVNKLTLGDHAEDRQSSIVVVSGLPVGLVSEHDIEVRLSPFGSLLRLLIKESKGKATQGRHNFCTVAFSEADSAKAAASSLNGTTVESWMNLAASGSKSAESKRYDQNRSIGSVAVVLQEACSITRNRDIRGVAVKVQWYAPSRCSWVHFDHEYQAQKAAKACDGKSLHGRIVTTKFQQPGHRQRTSFTTWIGNLAESVTERALVNFVQTNTKLRVASVSLGKLPFQDGPSLVQTMLRRFGPLTSFEVEEVSGQVETSLKQKALARFITAEGAEKACVFFRRSPSIDELGGSKLFVQRLFSLKYTLPKTVFSAIKKDSFAKLKQVVGIRYNIFESNRSLTLSITADDLVEIEDAKAKLDPIVQGEAIRDPDKGNRALWNRYVASNLFQQYLDALAVCDRSCVLCDKRRQELRVFGSAEEKQRLSQRILAHCKEATTETHAIPILPHEFEFILTNGRVAIDRIIRGAKVAKVSIDIGNRALLVDGNLIEARRVRAYVSKYVHGSEEKGNEDSDLLCPVCFCPPEDDDGLPESVIRLSCTHGYCGECFVAWVGAGNIRTLPLVCLSDECSVPVQMADLKKNLKHSSLLALLRTSVDDHVRSNPTKLQFCLAPTCPGIHEVDTDSHLSYCSTCTIVVCVHCQVDHGTMSCEEYRLASQPPDSLRMKVVDDILTLRCPRCRQAFLDFDGCFSIRCSICPCSFCGWCLEDCGTDAHSHVAKCPSKPFGANLYFGTHQQFNTAQNVKRRTDVKQFLAALSESERAVTLEAIQKDLDDLGLQL